MPHRDRPQKLRRREFLANLLFAGGALSLASLQGELAQVEEGWELPDEIEDRLKRTPRPPQPPPQEPPRPQPQPTRTPPRPDGGMRPPMPGRVAPPNAPPEPRNPTSQFEE